ncbi:nitroreductase family deazaflavin-dependent oxidoreductase [Actinoallomurus purpureus]|uniref:nitroreductase/quinone reductase family protein n=1 Tax=Actinoallomurus purpureus TaxID=478114 RepID=UPI002092E085|nr:nitroreductase/quinone reductase family protein [Actinoallomurus purpureus]MCO6010912.1 nitroreductase family deazaflavin-dependent oxidoreductase [Actinoallomurus purpureus]
MTTATESRHVQAAGIEIYFNKIVHFLTRKGISLFGTRILAVRGRASGEWRTNPVNLLTYDGVRYLVAPRGHTQWVRNIRVAGGGELRLGRRTEPFTVSELPDELKVPLLRHYFKRWGWEVARFFDEDIKDADDERLAAIAPTVPVFRIG